jgi:hypothetical protein
MDHLLATVSLPLWFEVNPTPSSYCAPAAGILQKPVLLVHFDAISRAAAEGRRLVKDCRRGGPT